MSEIFLKIFFAFLPVPFYYFLYIPYYFQGTRWKDRLESFLFGLILAILTVVLKTEILHYAPKDINPFFSGFFIAAFIEKTGSFLTVLFLLYKRKNNLNVFEGLVTGMLVGLGFSFFENLSYAATSNVSIILVRLFSAVPLHFFTVGMIGFYLSIALLSAPSLRRKKSILYAAFFPYLIHGLFDSFLFKGGVFTYLVGPVIVSMNAWVVYYIAKSQNLPDRKWLNQHKLNFSDWHLIDREPQYERWIIRSSGVVREEKIKLIAWEVQPYKFTLILVIFISVLAFLPLKQYLFSILRISLSIEEEWTLFAVLPVSYVFGLIAMGSVNSEYFKRSLIKIPIITDVKYRINGEKFRAITYEITDRNTFLKSLDEAPVGSEVRMVFNFNKNYSSEVVGVVVWDSHENPTEATGTLIRFTNRPAGFYAYLLKYYIFKITRGLSYNLRLPGFEGLRRLFVRPLTIMTGRLSYKAGDVVFREGDTGEEFFYIQKGEVEIVSNFSKKDKRILSILKAGEIFGEMVITGAHKRLATVVCRTDCIFSVADGENLKALIQSNPEFTQKLIKELAERQINAETMMKKSLAEMSEQLESFEGLWRFVIMIFLSSAQINNTPDIFKLGFKEFVKNSFLSLEEVESLEKFLMELLMNKKSFKEILKSIENEKSAEFIKRIF